MVRRFECHRHLHWQHSKQTYYIQNVTWILFTACSIKIANVQSHSHYVRLKWTFKRRIQTCHLTWGKKRVNKLAFMIDVLVMCSWNEHSERMRRTSFHIINNFVQHKNNACIFAFWTFTNELRHLAIIAVFLRFYTPFTCMQVGLRKS